MLNTIKDVVQESTNLAQRGDSQAALKCIDAALSFAVRERRDQHVVILSRHGSVIANGTDATAVERYLVLAQSRAPDDPMSQFALADYYARHGRTELSRRFARSMVALINAYGDAEVRELLDGRPDLKSAAE